MGIVFPDGTQDHPASVIQTHQHLFADVNSYSSSSNVYQDVTTATMTARSNISKLLVYIEVHGYNNTAGMDRAFDAQLAVSNGSFSSFGFNNVNTFNGMNTSFISNCRGDDHDKGYGQPFMFRLDNSWSDGNDLHVKLRTIGESTFYLNQGSQTAVDSGRFGRGITRIILQEVF
mgnify:CR=1 FL=1|tara:strand:+ start:42 stop:563 length:522 start_codon:yes stop_codon:yes gene_type:complete